MSEFGLKIKNIKAATLLGYNQGVRSKYDFTDAVFSNSMFNKYITANGLSIWKGEKTRDIICLEFDFGTRSYEEEINHLNNILEDCETDEEAENINNIIARAKSNKNKYIKMSADEIREHFYENGVHIEYITKDKEGNEKKRQKINYKMLYRSSAKAKLGQVIFINEKLYNKAYKWLTMGLGNKMDIDNAKIVEMSAYAPLTTSTIIGEMYIPVEDILILSDQDSFFKAFAKVVKSEEYYKEVKIINEEKTELNKQKAIQNNLFLEDGTPKYKKSYKKINKKTKKCVVEDKVIDIKNTLWDGMGLIESSYLSSDINGMVLLRNHFFKMCGFRGNIQLFFKDWCKSKGYDYNTYKIKDMFGMYHNLKDIKVITTDNSIKWKKFIDIMGGTIESAYNYWSEKINADGSYFGIVKTDHPSKLGDGIQQMSYQMVNTLPCSENDIVKLSSESVDYVELIKFDNDAFEKFLRKNSTEVNHYEMMADLYKHNKNFANSKWFRYEKSQIIRNFVDRLRKGKIFVNADNLTVCGNPYALLLYSVGEDWTKDPTLNYEDGVVQCYTSMFNDKEYLCGIRNPHNSPNNICYLRNTYSKEMDKYFPFSKNILALNCINTDIQSRSNGCDFDSDFFFVTNNNIMVNAAKKCYEEYPTIVNELKESGITYQNNMKAYANMDNKFAKSRRGIGESSNLAQLAMTYYWSSPSKELYDNFVILSVLAQVIIDGCKKEYEVDGIEEIKRIKKLKCMNRYYEYIDENGKKKKKKCDFPYFMKYTKDIQVMKNGKEVRYSKIQDQKKKIYDRIDKNLICPMNWLQMILNKIKTASKEKTTPTINFLIKIEGKPNMRQISKIRSLVDKYSNFIKINEFNENKNEIIEMFQNLVDSVSKIKIGNIVTINKLIFGVLDTCNNSDENIITKNTRIILNCLYKSNKEKFLKNFIKND